MLCVVDFGGDRSLSSTPQRARNPLSTDPNHRHPMRRPVFPADLASTGTIETICPHIPASPGDSRASTTGSQEGTKRERPIWTAPPDGWHDARRVRTAMTRCGSRTTRDHGLPVHIRSNMRYVGAHIREASPTGPTTASLGRSGKRYFLFPLLAACPATR